MNFFWKLSLESAAVVAALAATAVTPPAAVAAAFTAGNLAVFRSSSSANNTTVSILELNPTTANQRSAVQLIAIPDGATVANGLRFCHVN